MSDPDAREYLLQLFQRGYTHTPERMADIILKRFDVTLKPVVTEGDLGRMMVRCWGAHAHSELAVEIGRKMLVLLDNAGLRIVRVDDER